MLKRCEGCGEPVFMDGEESMLVHGLAFHTYCFEACEEDCEECAEACGGCTVCWGSGWVCEEHQDKVWADGDVPPAVAAHGCAHGAGAPCKCNPLSRVKKEVGDAKA